MIAGHRFELLMPEDGKLTLDCLPFSAGQRLEVVVSPVQPEVAFPPLHLRGSVLKYDNPTEPIAVDDWDAPS